MALSNDDIEQLIAILQRGLSKDTDESSDKKITKNKKPVSADDDIESVSPMKTKKIKISGNNKNQFLTMGFKDLHKEDIAIDKALNKFPPTPRTRKFKAINVVCRSCGKKESVNPVLLHDSIERYKCNSCSRSAG